MTEVLVAGAGPVGLALACELARHGVDCRIIDKTEGPSTLSKALAVHARSLEVLERMGTLQPFLERGHRVHGLQAWIHNDKPLMNIHFDELDSPFPYVLDLPQSETEGILAARLEQLGLRVERQVELIEFAQSTDSVEARLRHADGREEKVKARWLVGCDGAHSTVRHQLKVPFEGSAYPQHFILADVKIAWDVPENELHTFVHEDGLLAAFPYGKQRYRLMADVPATPGVDKEPDPTLEQFQRLVEVRGPKGTRLSDPVWLASFRSHLRHVKETKHGRVFLVGDAAHIHSPAGGQGMNTGIQDAFNLAWKLALVAKGKAGERLLDSFPAERLPVAESVLRMSDTMLTMLTTTNGIAQAVRNQLAPLVINQEIVQKKIRGQISEIAIHYRHSPIVEEHRTLLHQLQLHRLQAGDRAPDVEPLIGADGQERRLYERLQGSIRHTLLAVAPDAGAARAGADAISRWHSEVDTYFVQSGMPESPVTLHGLLFDPQSKLAQRYDIGASGLILIRPDGYIGYLSDALDFDRLSKYLGRLFQIG